jgi:hypothetical protein
MQALGLAQIKGNSLKYNLNEPGIMQRLEQQALKY